MSIHSNIELCFFTQNIMINMSEFLLKNNIQALTVKEVLVFYPEDQKSIRYRNKMHLKRIFVDLPFSL